MTAPNETARKRVREFRRVVANVVGELRSKEIRSSFAAVTLIELVQQHANRLDKGDAIRPSRKARLQKIYTEYKRNIEAIKATAPDVFRNHDPANDANTEP